VRCCWLDNMRARTSLTLTRTICHLSVGASIVCLIATALTFARVPDAEATWDALRLRSVHRSLGDVPPGAEIPVSFTVTNRCSRTVTLLGASQFCTDWGCVYASRFPVARGS
jgi:hypothetical protein